MNEMARPDQFDKPRPVKRDSARTALASLFAVLATVIGLIVLAWTVLFITKGRFLKPTFEKYASRSAQRDVRVAGDFQFYFNIIDIKFLAEGLTITNPAWRQGQQRYFLRSKLIDSEIETIPLIFGKQRADWLMFVNGEVDLAWSADGKQNTWTLGKPTGEPFELPDIRRALIQGTRIRYTDPRLQLFVNVGIDTVRAQDTRFAQDIRFGGNGTLRERPFTLTGSLMSPNETVSGGRNRFRMQAEGFRTVLNVAGTLPGATRFEGVPLDFRLRGYNLANAFDFLGVAVPDTRAYRLRSTLTRQDEQWQFRRLRGVFGASDLAGSLTVGMPNDRLKLDATLATNTLDIIDAGPFIGYNPERLDATGGSVTRANGGRILPDAPLRADAISRFDADVKWTVRRVRAESMPISNIDLKLDLDRSLLKLSPLTFDIVDRGHVSSDISINARGRSVFTDADVRLSPTPMGRLLKGFGVEEAGTTGTLKARVNLAGPGESVREFLGNSNGRIAVILPQGSLWTRNIQLSELDIGTFVQKMFEGKLKEPVQINCGLIAFTVRRGIAAADPILIDTRKNVVLGRGGFSFRNEVLDVRVRADSKKFSLFAGQSPVGIGGSFAAPKLDVISPQLVARGAAGLGLAAAASPLAGILAFVDIGDAEGAACGPVLAGARATAQREKDGDRRDDVGRGTSAKSESGNRSKEARKEQRKKFLGIF